MNNLENKWAADGGRGAAYGVTFLRVKHAPIPAATSTSGAGSGTVLVRGTALPLNSKFADCNAVESGVKAVANAVVDAFAKYALPPVMALPPVAGRAVSSYK